jgi:signal transduction histidine kinase
VRSRLIRGTLLVVVVAVVTLGGPLLVLARHQVWASADEKLQQQAITLAAEFEDPLSSGQPVDLSRISALAPGIRVVIALPDGTRDIGGATIVGAVRERSVVVGESMVTVEVAAAPTIAKARRATLLVVGLAMLSALIAVALAVRQARRLTAPLAGLADHADALGCGDFTPSSQVSGIGEIDAIARVLDRSAAQLGTLVALQRDLASDAAHQLRTPLTGIGLRLEEIARIGDPETSAEADAALGQVERLNNVITSLLARARGDAQEPTSFDLTELVREETAAWSRVLHQHRRTLVLDLVRDTVVRARKDHIVGIMTSLLDNALSHGSGQVLLRLRREANDVVLAVRDDGAGVPEELRPHVFTRSVSGGHGTGIGLALAHSLAIGEGGSLDLSPTSPAELILRLPAAA